MTVKKRPARTSMAARANRLRQRLRRVSPKFAVCELMRRTKAEALAYVYAPGCRVWRLSIVLCALAIGMMTPIRASAQTDAARPAFSLASSEIFTSKDQPAIYLTYQQLESLDFRVYRVQDPVTFFTSLKDPHVLGSSEPVVPQERTPLERIAQWKAQRRARIRSFFRAQLSRPYRDARRAGQDREQTQLRRTVAHNDFAQVPLLNPTQLVSSWRELLPRLRDVDVRRLPLELPGPGVYAVEAVHPPHRAYTIVVVSDVGVVTKTSPGEMLVFAAHRFTGRPVQDCRAQAILDQQQTASGATGEDGVFRAPLGGPADTLLSLVQCGNDLAVADPGAYFLREQSSELIAYVYTDKPIYRPGQTVRFKAILRNRSRDGLAPFDRADVEVSIVDDQDKVILRERANVDSFGAIHGSVVLPSTATLGYYSIRIVSDERDASGSFEVQEYRKPEFEVTVTPAERLVLQGRTATATVRARYYFGQPVASGVLKYAIYQSTYVSPFRWLGEGEEPDTESVYAYGGDQIAEHTVQLDEQGTATITVDIPVDDEGRDLSLRIDARVTDASEREVSGVASVIGTHGEVLIATSLDQYVYSPGSAATLQLRTLDYNGTARAGIPITVNLERVTYPEGRDDQPTITSISRTTVTTDAEGRATWTATMPPESGSYRFRATTPSAGREVTVNEFAFVPGRSDTSSESYDRVLELVADRKSYQPGDTARLMVRGESLDRPFLVTKEGRTVLWHKVITPSPNDASTFEVPIDEGDQGDVYVNIAFLKDDRLYRAERRLRIPALSRQVNVSIESAQAVSRPGQPALFTVRTTDQAGQPIRAQVSLAVVDEAVFGVKPDTTPDPLRFFHRLEYSRVGTEYSRTYSFVGYSGTEQLQLAQRRRPFTLADFKAEGARPHVRKDFPDAIYWIADLVTDASGTATTRLKYPDALTTWRLTARAVTTDTKVGGAVARTTTTKDLILRLVPPRFLTEGDELRLPVLTHNYQSSAERVSVQVTAAGLSAMEPSPRGGEPITIDPGGEFRADWPFRADRPGSATFTGKAIGASESDALELTVPVLPYGLKQEVGHSGSLSSASEYEATIAIPEASNPAARSIDVALAPSLAGSLLGALDFLVGYPYGCTEQTVSSFLPNLLTLRALNDLKLAPAERMAALDRMVGAGVRRLLDYQHEDGGWGWWKTDENDPFMTAYALASLIEASRAGYTVDRWPISQGISATEALLVKYPRAVPELKSYLLYVLSVAASLDMQPSSGDQSAVRQEALESVYGSRARMSAYGQALLLMALDQAGDARAETVANELISSAQTKGDLAWWTTEGDPLLGDWGDSSVEATATTIRALATRKKDDPLLERAVRYLLANRSGGAYWGTTKQTAMVLYGLLDYLTARGERPTTFTVDVQVNGNVVASHTLTPDSWTRADPLVVSAPATAGMNSVKIIRRGEGTLYWSVAGRFYDNRASLEAEGTRKLALSRRYFTLTPVQRDGRIVYREEPFSGTAKPGDLLLVRLTAAGANDWRRMILEDPLPAGAEAVTHPELYELESRSSDGRFWWYGSQREYRDNRVVQFQERFDQGRYDYHYLLKVVTPGTFRAMPARIAPMYIPGVFASSEPQTVQVVDTDQGR